MHFLDRLLICWIHLRRDLRFWSSTTFVVHTLQKSASPSTSGLNRFQGGVFRKGKVSQRRQGGSKRMRPRQGDSSFHSSCAFSISRIMREAAVDEYRTSSREAHPRVTVSRMDNRQPRHSRRLLILVTPSLRTAPSPCLHLLFPKKIEL